MASAPHATPPPEEAPEGAMDRRGFLQGASSLLMAGGLVAGYGTFFGYALRFLYPAHEREQAWLFLTDLKSMKKGDSLDYVAPTGEPIAVARQGEAGTAEDFIALSSTCPHLGCQVHWESVNNRFFCPCHNGTFDPSGAPTAGPPLQAGTPLSKYPLRVQDGLLFILVPLDKLQGGSES